MKDSARIQNSSLSNKNPYNQVAGNSPQRKRAAYYEDESSKKDLMGGGPETPSDNNNKQYELDESRINGDDFDPDVSPVGVPGGEDRDSSVALD
jgi:hypothetical protein